MLGDDLSKRGQTDAEILASPVEGAVTAPVIFFEEVPACAIVGGIGRVQLVAYINEVGQDREVITRKIAVAHLRGNAAAFTALRNAINSMELLAAQAGNGPAN